jgi:hypothetical protein
MPIDRSLYPSDWDMISLCIRERAGNKCEWCGAPNGALVVRGKHDTKGRWRLVLEEEADVLGLDGERVTKIVLTVAHLDHNPANNCEDNLAALCQWHHLAHDRNQHTRNAAATRRRKQVVAGQLELRIKE